MQFDTNSIVTLDFETYFDSEYSLRSKDLNLSEYVRDERFLAHCVSIKEGEDPTRVYWYDEIRPAIECLSFGPRPILAHNTAFDGFILSQHYGIVPHQYLDTLSMSRALYANKSRADLDTVSILLGLPGKNRNILGKMKGQRVIPPELREEAETYCKGDTEKCFEIFKRLIAVYPEQEIKLIDWTIRQFCDPVLYIDQPRAAAALEREIAYKAELVERTGLDEEDLQSAGKLARRLSALGVEPPTKISPKTHEVTYAFSLQDDEFLALALHRDEAVRNLIAARIAVKSTIGESRARRFVNVGERPLPVGLNYCAAHTLRWGGSNKTNLQNLEKEELDEKTGEAIPFSGELRKCIVAPEGHVLVVADAAQIEARILAWMAGQEDLLELFRADGDPYCALASDIYRRPITKADRDQRAVGKAGVLGLGFYCGAARFQSMLAAGLLGPKISMEIGDCWNVVRTYRAKNDKIVDFWKDMGQIIVKMWNKPRVQGAEELTEYKPNVVEYDRETVWLPNGLGLNYPDLQCEEDRNGQALYHFATTSGRSKIHGGILTENLIQALARVVIGEKILTIDPEYRVVMMTHDELIALAPVHKADDCLEFMIHEMSQSPSWAPGLPLKAEGGYDVCYSK